MVTDKAVDSSQTVWTLEELQVRDGRNESKEEEEAIKNEWMSRRRGSQPVDESNLIESYSFLEKFFEIQVL